MADAGYRTKPASYFRNARTEIVPLLPPFAERVLEVGCATGLTLDHLKRTGRAAWTCGIELHDEAARQAAAVVDEIHVGNVEDLAAPVAERSIDVILLLDVLEHLVDPWLALRRMAAWLKPGGHVIASIPNVRHYSVVLPLVLRGRWDYVAAGVLDRTHLRFFTRSSAIALLEHAGLGIDRQLTTGVSTAGAALNRLCFGALRPFLELQYLVRAQKPTGSRP